MLIAPWHHKCHCNDIFFIITRVTNYSIILAKTQHTKEKSTCPKININLLWKSSLTNLLPPPWACQQFLQASNPWLLEDPVHRDPGTVSEIKAFREGSWLSTNQQEHDLHIAKVISELTQEPNRQSSDGHQGLFQNWQTKHENRQTKLIP